MLKAPETRYTRHNDLYQNLKVTVEFTACIGIPRRLCKLLLRRISSICLCHYFNILSTIICRQLKINREARLADVSASGDREQGDDVAGARLRRPMTALARDQPTATNHSADIGWSSQWNFPLLFAKSRSSCDVCGMPPRCSVEVTEAAPRLPPVTSVVTWRRPSTQVFVKRDKPVSSCLTF